MQSIPHELLQLITEYLLPRYQCRLAITSRYYYKWLYTDLLKWHAQKAPIEVPKYMIYCMNNWANNGSSIYHVNNQVIVYRAGMSRDRYHLYANNFTKCIEHSIREYKSTTYNYINIMNKYMIMNFINTCVLNVPKYIMPFAHKNVLRACICLNNPLMSISPYILRKICGYISNEDIINLYKVNDYMYDKIRYF